MKGIYLCNIFRVVILACSVLTDVSLGVENSKLVTPGILQQAGFSPFCVSQALASCYQTFDQDVKSFEGDNTEGILNEETEKNEIITVVPLPEEDLSLTQEETPIEILEDEVVIQVVEEEPEESLTEDEELNPEEIEEEISIKDSIEEIIDCNDANVTGIGKIYLDAIGEHLEVFCKQDDCGGWLVVQRRAHISEERLNFNRPWEDYVEGFGNIEEEFWLGLKYLYELTSNETYELYVELTDFDDQLSWAKYSSFYVTDAESNFVLQIKE